MWSIFIFFVTLGGDGGGTVVPGNQSNGLSGASDEGGEDGSLGRLPVALLPKLLLLLL